MNWEYTPAERRSSIIALPTDHTYKPSQPVIFAQATGRPQSAQVPPTPTGQNDANICQHFLRGHCKFGDNCKKSHVQPHVQNVVSQPSQPESPQTRKLNEQVDYLCNIVNGVSGLPLLKAIHPDTTAELAHYLRDVTSKLTASHSTYNNVRERAAREDRINKTSLGHRGNRLNNALDRIIAKGGRTPKKGMEGGLDWMIEQGAGLDNEAWIMRKRSLNGSNNELDSPTHRKPTRTSSLLYPTLPLTSPTLFAPITGSYDTSTQGYRKLPGELTKMRCSLRNTSIRSGSKSKRKGKPRLKKKSGRRLKKKQGTLPKSLSVIVAGSMGIRSMNVRSGEVVEVAAVTHVVVGDVEADEVEEGEGNPE
ncbi:hypothetical protein EK21DRAFT_111969 [Setomelanomma holmii]|uniref:C3H1-type domain-containing protein n=1 Tax=Setomelanomma holmii TaxID=210430 RepID=A0A9P4H8X1_9PLEO|nr:hypothetical protein EK21DRAFT_111969 [Setomelanomma holmii]